MSVGLDLLPRIVFWTEAGAVVVTVDPDSVTGGTAIFPVIGAVPYAVDFDPSQLFPQPRIRLDFPTGPYYLPVDLSGLVGGGGSGGNVTIPGLGPATYEVVIGPPQIPEDQLASGWSLMSLGFSSLWPMLLLGVGAAWLMFRRR